MCDRRPGQTIWVNKTPYEVLKIVNELMPSHEQPRVNLEIVRTHNGDVRRISIDCGYMRNEEGNERA